jgi:hypothetical protein
LKAIKEKSLIDKRKVKGERKSVPDVPDEK